MKNLQNTKKKLSEISNRTFKSNLLKWIDFANAEQIESGKNWYNDAKSFVEFNSTVYNIDAYTIATVVSCLSPNNKWEQNKKDAIETLYFFKNNPHAKVETYLKEVKCCTYKANRKKAWEALQQGLEIQKNSPKTHSFAMNIALNSSDHITIDKWHLRACQVSPTSKKRDLQEGCTALQYRNIERITAEIAKKKYLKGYELQAIIWLTIKAKWER
tara:strand:+ start:241 stop:885 length:645 start_codon:yes stop_codon:yes gene_type:complete